MLGLQWSPSISETSMPAVCVCSWSFTYYSYSLYQVSFTMQKMCCVTSAACFRQIYTTAVALIGANHCWLMTLLFSFFLLFWLSFNLLFLMWPKREPKGSTLTFYSGKPGHRFGGISMVYLNVRGIPQNSWTDKRKYLRGIYSSTVPAGCWLPFLFYLFSFLFSIWKMPDFPFRGKHFHDKIPVIKEKLNKNPFLSVASSFCGSNVWRVKWSPLNSCLTGVTVVKVVTTHSLSLIGWSHRSAHFIVYTKLFLLLFPALPPLQGCFVFVHRHLPR